MKSYQLHRKIKVEYDIKEVFSFFDNAENLQKLTPDFLQFKILSPLPIEMKKGAIIDYRITLLGIPVNWRTEITNYHKPFHFCDEQVRGPYKLWRHRHNFSEDTGGTIIEDIIDYYPKGGLLAPLAAHLFVNKRLQTIFAYREAVIQDIF